LFRAASRADHGVQVLQHSPSPTPGPAAGDVEFAVPFVILSLARLLLGLEFRCRSSGEAACSLVGGDLLNNVCQATSRPGWCGDTDCDSHGAGRQSRLVGQPQLTVRI
jgi:hypothetical protein